MSVVEEPQVEPKILNLRDSLAEANGLRRQANTIEKQLHGVLEPLMWREVLMQPIKNYETRREVEGFGGFSGSVQLRPFGAEGWMASFNQLRPVPAQGKVVGFEVGNSRASITLASLSMRHEFLFDLRYFTVQLVEEEE